MWDEPTIAEHDKERGTRQKIDEPDTPFASYQEPNEDDMVDGQFSLVDGDRSEEKESGVTRLSRGISVENQEKGGEHGSYVCRSPTKEEAASKVRT